MTECCSQKYTHCFKAGRSSHSSERHLFWIHRWRHRQFVFKTEPAEKVLPWGRLLQARSTDLLLTGRGWGSPFRWLWSERPLGCPPLFKCCLPSPVWGTHGWQRKPLQTGLGPACTEPSQTLNTGACVHTCVSTNTATAPLVSQHTLQSSLLQFQAQDQVQLWPVTPADLYLQPVVHTHILRKVNISSSCHRNLKPNLEM